MSLLPEVIRHFQDFEKTEIWKLMQDVLKKRLAEQQEALKAVTNTRDMDMTYKGQIYELEQMLELPKVVVEYLIEEKGAEHVSE